MNFRTTTLLFGLLLGAMWVFGLMLALRKSSLDQGYVMPRLADSPKGGIDYLEIVRKEEDKDDKKKLVEKSYIFTKTPDGWRLAMPPQKQEIRVLDNKVEEIIDELRTARHSNADTDVTRSLSQWHLDSPSTTVTLRDTAADKKTQFFVGTVGADGKYAFVNSSERNRDVLAVKKSSIAGIFFSDVDSFRSRQLLSGNLSSAKAIKLTDRRDPKAPTVLALEKTDKDHWKFVTPKYGAADVEGSPTNKEDLSVSGLITAVTRLQAEKFEPLGSATALDENSALLKIELDVKKEVKDGKDPKGGKKDKDAGVTKEVLLIGDEIRDQGVHYAKLVGEVSVVQVSSKLLKPVLDILKNPRAMRSRDLAQFDAEDVDAVELKRGGEVVKLFKRGVAGWKVYPGDGAPRDANADAIRGGLDSGLLAALQGKRDIGEKDFERTDTPEEIKALEAKFAPEKIEARATVWIDSLLPETPKKDEPKKDEPKKEEAKKDDAKDKKDDAKKGELEGDKKDQKKDEKKDEKKVDVEAPKFKEDAKPVVTLSFVQLNKDRVLVKRDADGETMYFTISVSAYEKAVPPEMALAFFDTKITTFDAFDATKIELVRGPKSKEEERFLVEKKDDAAKETKDGKKDDKADKKDDKADKKDDKADKKDDKADKKDDKGDKKDDKGDKKDDKGDKDEIKSEWKIVEPKEFIGKGDADRLEVDRMLGRLATLKVERWERKVGKDGKGLEEYGLDSPSAVVSVTTKKKEGDKEEVKTFTLKVGRKSRNDKDKDGYYAIQDGTDLVFIVDGKIDKMLKDAEFRDKQVLTFDPTKAVSLQCHILNKDESEVRDPLFDRKEDKTWKIVKGTNIDLDSSRVEELVKKLSDLKAIRFLTAKMPAPKDYRLEGDKIPLKFEVTVDDGKAKTKHWLVVGAQQKEGGPYYATSSGMPGAVFLVPREQFEVLMGSLIYFTKTR